MAVDSNRLELMRHAYDLGNWSKTRILGEAILADGKTTGAQKEAASQMMQRIGLDPFLFWLGLASVVVACGIAMGLVF